MAWGEEQIVAMWRAGLAAVDPAAAVRRALVREGEVLWVCGRRVELRDVRHIWVVGAGKAGGPMVVAVEEVLGERVTGGVVAVKERHVVPTRRVRLVEAPHPYPGQASLEAARLIEAVADRAGAEDLVLCLFSGGGSALLTRPAAGITLGELGMMNGALLASGAPIDQVNTLRKHVSAIKGGQLARRIWPARHITLLLSDVVGDAADVIASGPTTPDPSTWADAQAVITRYGLRERLPGSVLARVAAGVAGELEDTPKPGDPVFEGAQVEVIAGCKIACEAAARGAELGLQVHIETTTMAGEARAIGRALVDAGRELAAKGDDVARCIILGGESTVRLGGAAGRGGRNQELALAALCAMRERGDERIWVGAMTTDGTDGPTDVGGAIVSGAMVAQAEQVGVSLERALQCHDATPALGALGALVRVGPTRTNVGDLVFLLVAPTG
jgi:hydroxypyruvate reductase